MIDIIVIALILLVIGSAVIYIIKEKKKGKRCIGCPCASECSNKGKCSCGGAEGEKKQ